MIFPDNILSMYKVSVDSTFLEYPYHPKEDDVLSINDR